MTSEQLKKVLDIVKSPQASDVHCEPIMAGGEFL